MQSREAGRETERQGAGLLLTRQCRDLMHSHSRQSFPCPRAVPRARRGPPDRILPPFVPAPMKPKSRVPASASRMSAHSAQREEIDAWFCTPSLQGEGGRERGNGVKHIVLPGDGEYKWHMPQPPAMSLRILYPSCLFSARLLNRSPHFSCPPPPSLPPTRYRSRRRPTYGCLIASGGPVGRCGIGARWGGISERDCNVGGLQEIIQAPYSAEVQSLGSAHACCTVTIVLAYGEVLIRRQAQPWHLASPP